MASLQAQEHGFDQQKVSWNLAVALTALAPQSLPFAPSLAESWTAAGHEEFVKINLKDRCGRFVAPQLERQRVMLTSHLIQIGGGWDLTEEWLSEVVIVQPLSPCHGRILHPALNKLPADFDDLILWDPQPVGFQQIDGEEQPILKALAVLEKGQARVKSFPYEKLSTKSLNELNQLLPDGVFFYQSPEMDTATQAGKFCWPTSLSAQEAAKLLEEALKKIDHKR